MDKVRIYEERRWIWQCPKCKKDYAVFINPTRLTKIVCTKCGAEFIPDDGW